MSSKRLSPDAHKIPGNCNAPLRSHCKGQAAALLLLAHAAATVSGDVAEPGAEGSLRSGKLVSIPHKAKGRKGAKRLGSQGHTSFFAVE
jgi:hypothetical protein